MYLRKTALFVAVFLLDGALQLYSWMPAQGTDCLGLRDLGLVFFPHSFSLLFCHSKQQLLYLFHITYFETIYLYIFLYVTMSTSVMFISITILTMATTIIKIIIIIITITTTTTTTITIITTIVLTIIMIILLFNNYSP